MEFIDGGAALTTAKSPPRTPTDDTKVWRTPPDRAETIESVAVRSMPFTVERRLLKVDGFLNVLPLRGNAHIPVATAAATCFPILGGAGVAT